MPKNRPLGEGVFGDASIIGVHADGHRRAVASPQRAHATSAFSGTAVPKDGCRNESDFALHGCAMRKKKIGYVRPCNKGSGERAKEPRAMRTGSEVTAGGKVYAES